MASVKQGIILILNNLLIIYRGSNHFVLLMSRVDFKQLWYHRALWNITTLIPNLVQIRAKFLRITRPPIALNHFQMI